MLKYENKILFGFVFFIVDRFDFYQKQNQKYEMNAEVNQLVDWALRLKQGSKRDDDGERFHLALFALVI